MMRKLLRSLLVLMTVMVAFCVFLPQKGMAAAPSFSIKGKTLLIHVQDALPKEYLIGGKEDLPPHKIRSFTYNSDQSQTGSVGLFKKGKATVNLFYKADQGRLNVKTMSGKTYRLNLRKWKNGGRVPTKFVSDEVDGLLLQYGNYKPINITINSDGTAALLWKGAQLRGFVAQVNPADVSWIGWASDLTGWGSNCLAKGVLEETTGGVSHTCLVTGIPMTSHKGLFFIMKHDGTQVWQNIDGPWVYTMEGGTVSIIGSGHDKFLQLTYTAPAME